MTRPPADWVPFLWPAAWRDPAKIDLIRGTVFNCAIGDDIAPPVREALNKAGIDAASLKTAPVTVLKDARWPQVRTGSNGDADAGPTGSPWIDSNGYAIQIARALAPGKPVWLNEAPPANRALKPDDYCLAICDAAVYGGHWLPSPAFEAWPRIAALQKFFLDHREWDQFRPAARLGVISDFTGPHYDLAMETLNLLTRQYVPFEIIPESRAGEFREALRIDAQDASTDPWELAMKTRDKVGRRNDLFRLWNGGSIYVHYKVSSDARTGLVHLVNYAARVPGEAVTLGVTDSYRLGKIYTLAQPDGAPVPLHRVQHGVEIYLPPSPVYAAIELRK